MNKIIGYKAFSNMCDQFGNTYQVGFSYKVDGPVKFMKNGFHFCTNIEDVFRYYDGFDDNTNICLVMGFGDSFTYDDEYYDYYDMHVCSNLVILRVLSREEILDIMLKKSYLSIRRFVSGYKLTEGEISLILDEFGEDAIGSYIDYYQKKEMDAFSRKR